MSSAYKIDRSGRLSAFGLVLAAALALQGCAHGAQRRQQGDLTELQRALPGVYSSEAPDAGVILTVSPVTAQLIGDVIYFVRETPANNASLVLWQGLWTLTPQAAGAHRHAHDHDHDKPGIVQHVFLFKDPRRWADASDNPDLLVSMLPQDLQALAGCDLVWRKTDSGFQTEGPLRACHPGSHARGLWVEEHARLQGSDFTLDERLVTDGGALDLRGAAQSLHLTRTGTP